MNKIEFIKKLAEYICDLPKEVSEEILYDYKEHFRMGIEKGRNEEGIAVSLEDPKNIAKQVIAENMIKKAENTTSANNIIRAIFAAVGLGFLTW